MIRPVFAFALFLAATPAFAQIGRPSCSAVLEKTASLLAPVVPDTPLAGKSVRQGPRSCSVSDLAFEVHPRLSYRVGKITWSGEGFEQFVEDGLPPTGLVLNVEGLRVIPAIGDPVMDYLFGAQAASFEGIDIGVTFDWVAETERLLLRSVRADFPGDNSVWIDATIEGVDLSSRPAAEMSLGRFAVTRARAEIRTFGLFEQYVLMALGAALLNDAEDPAARVAELKAQAARDIDALPDTIFSVPSRVALKALVQDLPNPRGTITIDMTASPGLGPARFLRLATDRLPDDLTVIWPLLEGVRYDIRYDNS